MLFSQNSVADFINQSFEPVWESVRPVPIVRIDFGNGNVLTRTLHGNILTSICTSDGLLVDALPGIYREAEYLSRLALLGAVARNAEMITTITKDRERLDVLIRAYHRGRAQAIEKFARPDQVAAEKRTDPISKAVIERPLELALLPEQPPVLPRPRRKPGSKPNSAAAEDVANWKELEDDTRLNDHTRRLQIHELLARAGLVNPEKVTRSIYKEVLHADLDDPYLGLGEVLFAKYPFAKEDAAH